MKLDPWVCGLVGLMGLWACGLVGCGLVGLWACELVGLWVRSSICNYGHKFFFLLIND